MKPKLITLPSGDAINPEFVIAVRSSESIDGFKDRINIEYSASSDYYNVKTEYFESEEAAKTFQAWLIQQVNESK